MRRVSPFRKVLWAIDPFQDGARSYQAAASVVKNLIQKLGTVVEPVYVLSPAQLNLSSDFSAPWIHQYRPAAEAALKAMLSSLRLPKEITPKVLIEESENTAHAADSFCSHAVMEDADAILVNTHARGALKRWVLGSFTESLMQKAKIPILVVGPGAHKGIRNNRILFPTDFAKDSKRMFRYVANWALQADADIVLLHAIPHPIEPIFQSGVYLLGGSWIPVQTYFSREVDRQTRRAHAWARWAQHQGVKVEVVIKTRGEPVADTISHLITRKHIGWVAMETQSGPISSVLIGSVTRQVLKRSPVPVLVLRAANLRAMEITPAKKRPSRRAA